MIDRDMMYGGYYQSIPGNMAYANYGYQMPPGAMLNNGMLPQMTANQNNPLLELNNRITNLENRVKLLEQKINTSSNTYQDDNSIYMI